MAASLHRSTDLANPYSSFSSAFTLSGELCVRVLSACRSRWMRPRFLRTCAAKSAAPTTTRSAPAVRLAMQRHVDDNTRRGATGGTDPEFVVEEVRRGGRLKALVRFTMAAGSALSEDSADGFTIVEMLRDPK